MNHKNVLGVILAVLMLLSGCAGGDSAATAPTVPGVDRLSEHDLVCVEYSSFTGAYPEDGTGRQVENVAAMLIRNDSGIFLDYAIVVCDIGSDTGTFKVTGLPAGAAVWVMEQNGKTLAPEDRFAISECKEYVFRSDAIQQTDKLSVATNGNTLTVTNKSKETLENVCIYYKTVHSDGNFFGGITYMLGFDTLAPGETAQKQSSHFGADAKIVRYSFQEQ